MKSIFAVAIAFLVVINLQATGIHAQTQPSMTPEETVRRFYELYLHSLNQNEEPLEKHRTELGRYVTRRLMRSYDRARRSDSGINADFFIDAQDFDNAWEKNISVSKPMIRGTRALVTVMLKGGKSDVGNKTFDDKLKVGLLKIGGVWKIDTVNGKANVT